MECLAYLHRLGQLKLRKKWGTAGKCKTLLSNLKLDDFRHQKVPLLWQLSSSSHRLQLAPADAIQREFSHRWPFLALFPGAKEVRVAKIKSA